jgi:hypothetical protein
MPHCGAAVNRALAIEQGCARAVQIYGDGDEDDNVLYVDAEVTYSSILIKVYAMIEYALKSGARWLLKTDDDAYINVPQTVQVRALYSS